MLSGLVGMIPLTSGIFFVWWFHGEDDAGIYGLVQQIAVAYMASCAIGTRILQPHIAGPYGHMRSFIKKGVT